MTRMFTAKERQAFSLARVIARINDDNLRGCFEAEILQDVALRENRMFDPTAPVIPWELLGRRDMSVAGASGSQYLVSSETAAPEDVLRPVSVIARAGATIVTGLRANLALPQTGTAITGYWLADENTQITEGQPAIGAVSFTPKVAAAILDYSRQLNVQVPELEAFLRRDLIRTVAAQLDAGAIQGAGTSGAPMGLIYTPNVNTQSGTSLDWTGVCEMERLCAASNAEALSWVAGPTTRKLLRTRATATGGVSIWDGNTIAGSRAWATTSAPADSLLVGDFAQCVVAIWGAGPQLLVNPYQSFATGGVSMRVMLNVDVGFLSRAAFAISTSIT